MASSLYNLALDFSKELNYTKAIMARQGDKGITVTVKPFLNGLQMDTSGGTFTLKGTTPSNRYVDSVATSVTSEEVTFSLDGTFMSEAGYYKHCYVEYRKGNQILTTQDIIFFSLGVSDISQGQADEYVSQLEELIQKYNETFDAFMAEIKGRVDSLNQQITDLTGQAKTLQDKLDQLKEEISKLGNLQVMYSNSLDFGNYDYSGNPNLITNLSYSDISTSWTQEGSAPIPPSSDLVIDNGDSFTVDLSKFTGNLGLYFNNLPRPLVGKNYAWSIELKSEEPLAGNVFFVRPVYTNASGILSAYAKPINTGATTEMTRYSTTYTNITDIISNSKCQSLQMYFPKELPRTKVTIKYNIKVEQVPSTSDTATPYQPNLLVEPYYLSKTALGKNIRRTDVGNSLPRTTTEYQCYVGNIEGYYEANQDYVITMKATKPATQTFGLYLLAGSQHAGNLMPVEGLTDTWQLNFRPTKEMIDAGVRNQINIFQVPQSTKGEVKIDWIKLEKGDTRTPNIEQYKYRGIGMRDSNNPKDYVWDLAPEYVEDNLATDVKISEITGKANNYTDGKVSEINSQLTASINEVDTTAKDAQTKANANATAIEDTKSRVDEIENNLYVLGEWKTLPLENGYTGADGTTPQYRVNLVNGHRNVVFNGAISTTAGTLPSQGQQHNASTLPTELIPSGTKMGLGATSLFTTSCRLAVTGKGTLYIGNDSGKDVKYCYLDLFSYWLD
ncbi:hypothetical protein HQ674_11325 [Enterococcus faecium]|uniref:BppU family phage baseplate upper protein n=1 Tax=Enterococcus faecium TaxID=1352 RepID=UPI00189ECBB1|nr:BppU family phage baseplate upper protein [Enterococcus faecium]EME8064482.1 hypothetical protein [Enterococcus faecium]NTL72600.1 hypothetical protein [Enterococcus faecium]